MKQITKLDKKENILSKLITSIDPLSQKKVDAKMMLAARIDDILQQKKWRNLDLLKAVRKDNPSIITKWLSGTHNFTVDTLVELEDALDIKLLKLEPERTEITLISYHFSISSVVQVMNKELPFLQIAQCISSSKVISKYTNSNKIELIEEKI